MAAHQSIAYAALALTLSGCSSVGVQHNPPGPSQEAAELMGHGFYVNQFNEKGCYAGRTYVAKATRLHPGKRIVIADESSVGNSFCRVLFAFTPEENARYELLSSRTNGGRACQAAVFKLDGAGGREPVAITNLKLEQTGIACIRATR